MVPVYSATMCRLNRIRLPMMAQALACSLLASGCSALLKPPVRMGTTTLDLSPPLFLPRQALLQRDLEVWVGQPVVLDLMTPRQIRVHLNSGRMALAMLSPAEFSSVAPECEARILAVPVNGRGSSYRKGLIITAPASRLQSLSQISGKRFHFMPLGDILNEAALGALIEAGVDGQHIDRGILGLGLDTSHISSLEVAKSVVLEEQVAGVIDEADYNAWPATGGSLVFLIPSKDQVRVIGETVRVPEGPVVISNSISQELQDKLRRYFLEKAGANPLAMASLGFKGFAPPIAASEYDPYFRIHRNLFPEQSPGSQPASAISAAALITR